MQSEFACHMGLRAKFFCRNCWVKGRDAAANSQAAHHRPAATADNSGSESEGGMSLPSLHSSYVQDNDGESASDASESLPQPQTRGQRVKESMDSMLTRVTAFLKVSNTCIFLFCSLMCFKSARKGTK